MARHRAINIGCYDSMCLFVSNLLGDLFCCKLCWNKQEKLTKVYEETNDRLESELDIVKLLRTLRNSKILLKNTILNDKMRFEIAHSEKNVVGLDSDD